MTEQAHNDTAQQGAVGGLMQLDDVELSFTGATEDTRRNFKTLIVEPTQDMRGGLGKIAKVRTVAGQLMACKQMLVPDRQNFQAEGSYEKEFANRESAFREEYETLCKLSNFKGFVKAYGYGRMQGTPVILMEWVDGTPVSKAIGALADGNPQGTVPALRVAQLGRDVFKLLARLEWQTELFVHRDISPANIMLRESAVPLADQMARGEFDVCFIDFGSAAAMRATDGTFTTMTHILRGATPDYAPPEMLSNDLPGLAELRKSSKIDVYATCSVLYKLLCGHVPYDLGSKFGSDYLHKMQNPPLPLELPEGSVEDLLGSIVVRGIAPTQDARPSSYAMYKMLEFYIAHFDENVGRASQGKDLLAANPRSIDMPDLEFEQISFSNPLSHVVVENAMAASDARSQGRPAFVTQGQVQTAPAPAQPSAAQTPAGQVVAAAAPATAQLAAAGTTPRMQAAASQLPGAVASAPVQAAGTTPRMQQPPAGYAYQQQLAAQQRYAAAAQYVPAAAPAARKSGSPLKIVAAVAVVAVVFAAAFLISSNVAGGLLGGSGSGDAAPAAGSSAAASASARTARGEDDSASSELASSAGSDAAVPGEPGEPEASGDGESPEAAVQPEGAAEASAGAGWSGTWSGQLQETSTGYACYGADGYELVLVVGEATASGRVGVDATVLFHGHNRTQLSSDIDSSPQDYYLSIPGQRATMDEGSFTLTVTDGSLLGRGNSIVIYAEVVEGEPDAPELLAVSVESNYGPSSTVDVYYLSRH